MDAIKELINGQGLSSVVFILVLVLLAAVLLLENISKFRTLAGIKTVKEIHEEQQENTIKKLEKELYDLKTEVDEIREYSYESTKKRNEFETSVTESLKELKREMLDNRIQSYRGVILDYANAIKSRDYNKENFDHVLEIYDLYEGLLAENKMTNGKTDMAIAYIKKKYAQYMEEGFPVY